ncbi:MAG: DNA polymerase III subunit chi [Alphaproteobacteria bacterium]|nr:DNA polymerase III subunit chi [Alphaproteobacteria bacterium]
MTEALFYHLRSAAVDDVLPPLLEKSLERGWRVVVQSTSAVHVEALDGHLWSYRDDSFLPHGRAAAAGAAAQPVVLALDDANPNCANVRFLIDCAAPPGDCASYDRVVVLFNGDDPEALAAARRAWKDCTARGFTVTYWQPDDQGRWRRRN